MRINRFLSQAGIASRRAADELVKTGQVKINSRVAVIGDEIEPESDVITLKGKPLTIQKKLYLAFYKPRNVITSMSDPQGRPCVKDYIPYSYKGVFPSGRLDFDAEGLIILTNDGDFANIVHHPSYSIPKIYIVELKPKADLKSLKKMSEGVILDGKKTRTAVIEKISDAGESSIVKITLRQGLKNQIKRMSSSVGLDVVHIKRISVGPIGLDSLKPGEIRVINRKEMELFHNMLKAPKSS